MYSRHKIDNIAKGLYIVVYSCTCAETLLLVWNFINILFIWTRANSARAKTN